MGDNHSIRCKTCCTAAVGGDPLLVPDDHNLGPWAPFIGGLENSHRVRHDDALEIIKAAPRLKSICAQIVAFLADNPSREEVRHQLYRHTLYFDIKIETGFDGDTKIDPAFFAAHGDHDLTVMVADSFDDDACHECWWPHHVVRPRGHEGPHGRPP